jgi:hypothetical protein
MIGNGSPGGKAQGLVSIRSRLLENINPAAFPGITIEIPPLAVLCSDIFTAFMQQNDLEEITRSDLPDERIALAFQRADLPFEVVGTLRNLVNQVHIPLAVRSSSLLEDAEREPYAGIYTTKMIPNSQYDPDVRFRQLVQAVKVVYASTFYKAARNYRQAVGRAIHDEQMAVIIQETAGKRYLNRFYPELSGVARSYNFYPMSPGAAQDGVVSLALGLGKTIVDGGESWTYSPAYPKVDPPFGSVEKLLKSTQARFWAVTMGDPPMPDPTRETEYMVLENLLAAEKDGALRYLASTYDPQAGTLSAGTGFRGPRAITFAPLLALEELPINEIVKTLLHICEEAYAAPVEIEFAMSFHPHRFSFLQVRRMVVSTDQIDVDESQMSGPNVFTASHNALGNGSLDTLQDIVYVKPEVFELKHTHAIVPELRQINEKLLAANTPYLLVVMGRLGTTDPWLGIPIQWGQICGARAVVESAQEKARVDLSQGSHYFHNIINLGVKYFLLPYGSPHKVDWEWLDRQTAVNQTRFVRHVRLQEPLAVRIDGRTSRGVIFKSGGQG